MSAYDWMGSALCAQTDPDLWHGDGNWQTGARICQACPVQAQCLAHAEAMEQQASHRYGTWGGTTRSQRNARARARAGTRSYDDDIARLTRLGRSAREIAEQLGCTSRTVSRARQRMGLEATA